MDDASELVRRMWDAGIWGQADNHERLTVAQVVQRVRDLHDDVIPGWLERLLRIYAPRGSAGWTKPLSEVRAEYAEVRP